MHNKLVENDKFANLNNWVLRTFQKMSLLAASLMWFGNLYFSLGADAGKDLSPYIAVWHFGTIKSE
jgi:hypothetical protein